MITPVWLMWIITPVAFIFIPFKLLIDWFLIYLPLGKEYNRKEITVKASWKIWLTDIGAHLIATGLLYATLFIDPLFRSNPSSFDEVKEISNNTPDWIVGLFEGLIANPFDSIFSAAVILILFLVLILGQYQFTKKIYAKYIQDDKQIIKSSIISTLAMAPWIILIPTALFTPLV